MKFLSFLLCSAALAGTAMADDGSGVIVLDRSASGALSMTGNSSVLIPARAVFVNSNSPTAITTAGNAVLNAPNLYVCGGTNYSGHSGCTGVTHRGALPCQDPMSAFRFPSTAGMASMGPQQITSSRTLNPGNYDQGISISGNAQVTLNPGAYLIGGSGFRLTSGSVIGSGVTLVMLQGSLSLAGNGNVQLSPPGSGDMGLAVIVQPCTNGNAMSLAGGSNMIIVGSIYAPAATIGLTGNSTAAGSGPQMGDVVIANRLSLTGTSQVRIGRLDMHALSPPRLPLCD